jgi:Glyoxalase-like domain
MVDQTRTFRLRSVVLDCPDPPGLATFYGALLAGEIDTTDPDWCEVHLVEPRVKLAFQRVEEYQAPEWPNGRPQQAHLDITVVDLQATSRRAVELGAAVLAEPVADEVGTFQVHADPSGHPFCLCVDDEAAGLRPAARVPAVASGHGHTVRAASGLGPGRADRG